MHEREEVPIQVKYPQKALKKKGKIVEPIALLWIQIMLFLNAPCNGIVCTKINALVFPSSKQYSDLTILNPGTV